MSSLYPVIYASLVTLAFVAATAYAIGRAHDARNRTEAFRLGWKCGFEYREEHDLRVFTRARQQGLSEQGLQPPAPSRQTRTAMPFNERRLSPRPRHTTIEDAETMDLAGRR